MNASQMYNEFEIVYEAIATGDAPGYEPYEVSILLTESQEQIIKEIVKTGAESSDVKSLVIGPLIKPDIITPSTEVSSMYEDSLEFTQDTSSYWLLLGERLKQTGDTSSTEVKPITHEFWEANGDNPYKQPKIGKHFWRLIQGGKFIITGVTSIATYYINYLDKPTPIIVPGVDNEVIIDGITVDSTIVVSGLDCNYNSIIHRDIINKAAQNAAAYIKDTESFQLLKAKYEN